MGPRKDISDISVYVTWKMQNNMIDGFIPKKIHQEVRTYIQGVGHKVGRRQNIS